MISKHNLNDMSGGWFVGKFTPTIFRSDVEVGYKKHKKDEKIPTHYHRGSYEITLVTKGLIRINGETYKKDDIFTIYPYTVAEVEILEDYECVVFRDKDAQGDKVLVYGN